MQQQDLMPQQVPFSQATQQQLKFYKSGFFGFTSAAGNLQRDSARMQREGWKLQYVSYLGINLFLQRTYVVSWIR